MSISRACAVGAAVIILVTLIACKSDVDYIPASEAERNEIVTALGVFRQDTGRYPTSEEGLRVLVYDPSVPGWQGPYYPESKLAVLAQYGYGLAQNAQNGQFKLERLPANSPVERKDDNKDRKPR